MINITLDTNILCRYFLEQSIHPEEIKHFLYSGLFEVLLPDAVIFEFVFTLTKKYNATRYDVAEILKELKACKNIKIDLPNLEEILDIFLSKPKLSFIDISIFYIAQQRGYLPLYSYDKALQKLSPENILNITSPH